MAKFSGEEKERTKQESQTKDKSIPSVNQFLAETSSNGPKKQCVQGNKQQLISQCRQRQ